MKTKDGRKESRVKRCLKSPARCLIRARDLYVRTMISCAGRFSNGDGVYGCPTTVVTTLPRSFSFQSTIRDDDFIELVRVASTKSLRDRIDLDFKLTGASEFVPRSKSLAIGRIDEKDDSSDFRDNKVLAHLFPRSRSYDVP